MAKKVTIKQGDTRPSLRHKPQIDGGKLSDPGLQVFFTMMDNTTAVADMATCRIEGAEIVYDWELVDTSKVRNMQAEFKMVWPDGSIESEPLDGFIEISVVKSLRLYRPGNMAPGLSGGAVTVEDGDVVITPPAVTGSPTPQLTRVVKRDGVDINATGNRITDAPPGIYAVTWTAANGVGAPATISLTATVEEPEPITEPPTLAGGSIALGGDDVVIVEPTADGVPMPTVTRAVTRDGTAITVVGQRIPDAAAGTYVSSWRAENGVGQPATVTRSLTVEPKPVLIAPTLTGGSVAQDGDDLVITEPVAGGTPSPTITRSATLDGQPIAVTGQRVPNATPGAYAFTWMAQNGVAPNAMLTLSCSVPAPPDPTPGLEARPAGFRLNAYDDPGYELTPTAGGFRIGHQDSSGPDLTPTANGFLLNDYDDPGYELTPTAEGFKLESANG